ncbi:uncharacterized protein LOC111077066 [Drosophila obscura]|uniref:uncharacterized protein LOC111077066 n=1 Tax=Drosophila obscura TaxID=7282 RepID=UPI001BB10DD2|nr:uncharacterized protein LOC111077066 [Drosophila obscura]
MADLPKDRVNASYTFAVTGVDFCGPFFYKSEAVHLELVQDLSTPAFISALKRFIFPRGRPREIWKLFLAERYLKEVQEFCVADHIDWQFIPPRSHHFGGLWEVPLPAPCCASMT